MKADCPECGVHMGEAGNPDFYDTEPPSGIPPIEFCPYCGAELDYDDVNWWEDDAQEEESGQSPHPLDILMTFIAGIIVGVWVL